MGISREEILTALGVIRSGPHLDPWTERASVEYEKKVYEEGLDNSPHGQPWHTSFHASAFPGAEKSCGRYSIYTLMDIPGVSSTPPGLRGMGEVGKAVEYLTVHRWGVAGLTLGGSTPIAYGGPQEQIKFEDRDYWLTGSGDAILDLRPEWKWVLPVDVKSKAKEKIDEMKLGMRKWDEAHYAQIQAYIYLCGKYHEEMGWDKMGLLPAKGGIIYYCSRENPRHTAEFYVERDDAFIDNALVNLDQWRADFQNGFLPERDKSWKWTEEPCKWCKFKKAACKPDLKAETKEIKDSVAFSFARTIRPNYDENKKIEEVEKRWM